MSKHKWMENYSKMDPKTEKAILLALEALVSEGRRTKAKAEALEAITSALEANGMRMPENDSGW